MNHRSSRLRRIAGTAALATLALATVGTGVAGAAESGTTGSTGRGRLTADQVQCLKDNGITRPTGRPTAQQVKDLRAAAKTCDIPLGRIVRHRVRHAMHDLTAEQRQCLEDAGVTKPEGRPSLADLKAFAEAAKSCDIPLREHRGGLNLTDAQRQCLADAGITKPTGEPTQEQRDAMKAAAESCGITLPARPEGMTGATGAAPEGMQGDGGRRGPGPRLTDTQRQCLADAGITRPTGPPTEDQRTAMRSAAESCGITVGRR